MAVLAVNRNIPLSPLHTFASDHQAACSVTLCCQSQIDELIALLPSLPKPVRVLGGGSNVVFTSDYAGTLILNGLKGRTCLGQESARQVQHWRVGAGERWHDWVKFTVELGLSGLENLALIPGTVGAAPIQNIGAYGVELASVCLGVMARELATGRTRYFKARDCQFGYRESVFKSPELANRWLITAVDFELSQCFKPQVFYPALQARCPEAKGPECVFEAVCAIRRERLPDPQVLPNAGSFFKNPIIRRDAARQCLEKLPNQPVHPVDESRIKLSAAYLIEAAGLKGMSMGSVGVCARHALVLVRLAPGPGEAIAALAKFIQERVMAEFNVLLEIEPQVWSDQA